MATRIGQELFELTFAQQKTQLNNGTLGYDPEKIDRFVKAFEAYEREIKRVFGSVVTTVSVLDEKTRQAIRKVYLPREYENEVLGIQKAVYDQRQGAGIDDNSIMYATEQKAHFVEGQKEIKGAKAQRFAKEEVLAMGGKIEPVSGTSNKDLMLLNIPVTDTELNNMKKKDIPKVITNATPKANKASRAEQVKRNEEEREAQLEAEAKLQQKQLKENKRRTELQNRLYERQQAEKEKLAEQEEKEKIQSRKQIIGLIGKVSATLGILVDIARRILTSVINFGRETSKQNVKANTLTTSLADVRALNYMDTALGLDKGTTLQAQEDFRQAFGNTANINTEALKWLAMVMGDEVGQAVQMGLGRDNPAKLVEMSIDAFYKQWQAGKDQFGNEVGQEQARRALVTVLEQVSPSLARVFERMIEEQIAGLNQGEVASYRQFQGFYIQGTGGLSENDWQQIKLIGDKADLLKASINNLSDIIKGSLLQSLSGIIGKLNSLGLGKTEGEQYEDEKKAREWLVNRYNELEERKSSINKELEDIYRESGLGVETTVPEMVELAGKEKGSGVDSRENYRIAKAKEAIATIQTSPYLWNRVKEYYAIEQMQKKVEEHNKGTPNADKEALGDVALTRLIETSTGMLDMLGYYDPYGYESSLNNIKPRKIEVGHYWYLNGKRYTDEELNEAYIRGESGQATSLPILAEETEEDVRRRYENEVMTYSDWEEGIRPYIESGTEDFFSEVKKNSENKAGRKSNVYKAFQDIVNRYNKVNGTKYKEEEIINLYDEMHNEYLDEDTRQQATRMLYNIMSFALSSTQVTKIKGSTEKIISSAMKYSSDEYGLNKEEYDRIWQSITTAQNLLSTQSGVRATEAKLTQGDTAGTIKITLVQKDENGIEKTLTSVSVAGEIEEDRTINLSNEVNQGRQNAND